ncbi:MAG: PH domain-containing protein [Proteobacteria bacterium]|nr:PH domain-containing protein [Pseudomonadota bacterium]
MSWPEDALSHDETIITSFRPHWKLLFIPFAWFVGILVVIGLSFGFVSALAPWISLIVLLAGLYLVARPLVNWWFTRYVLTTERLITRQGLIAQSGVEIPLERITNVNFSQTVFERMLGAGDLLIESAGTSGQSSFSNIPHPDEFQTILYKIREQRTIEMSGRSYAPVETTTEFKPHAADSIKKLAELRDQGLISAEEYEEKRKKLLDEI